MHVGVLYVCFNQISFTRSLEDIRHNFHSIHRGITFHLKSLALTAIENLGDGIVCVRISPVPQTADCFLFFEVGTMRNKNCHFVFHPNLRCVKFIPTMLTLDHMLSERACLSRTAQRRNVATTPTIEEETTIHVASGFFYFLAGA